MVVLTGEDHSLSRAASDGTAQCWELGGELMGQQNRDTDRLEYTAWGNK